MIFWLSLLLAEVGVNILALCLLARKGKKKQLEMYLYPNRFTSEERGRWELIPDGFLKNAKIGAHFFFAGFKRNKKALPVEEPLASVEPLVDFPLFDETADSEDAIMCPHEDVVASAESNQEEVHSLNQEIKKATDRLDKIGNLDFMPAFIKGFIISLAAIAFVPRAYAWVSLVLFFVVMGYFWVNVLTTRKVADEADEAASKALSMDYVGDMIADRVETWPKCRDVDSALRDVKRQQYKKKTKKRRR